MRENRESPQAPEGHQPEGRPVKAIGRKTGMNASGQSDGSVVPTKRANKAGKPVAESVEGRGPANGNTPEEAACRTQNRSRASIGLVGVREAAKRDRKQRFTTLLHHITPELLAECFHALKKHAAPGLDGMVWSEYRKDLDRRLEDLHGRIHRGSYRASPSKRVWIPKGPDERRPLGIACLEDKIVQQAVVTVLNQIYEVDFCGFSYAFRENRSPHRALDAVTVGIERRKVSWVLDADIRGFFDTIDHAWLIRFLEHRIADRRILRLIQKWLRVGVSEDGEWSKTTVGTPQGAVISPLLANVYLHYVLDLWVDDWRRRHAEGEVIFVRYADDFILGFQHRHDAEGFLSALRERLQEFGLEIHPDKTRLLEFGRFAAANRADRGEGPPETFDFLGFTHCCGKTRTNHRFCVERRPSRKRVRRKLSELKDELRRRMHLPLGEQGKWLKAVVQGWLNYYAVPRTIRRLDAFRKQVTYLWRQTLSRRSQKGTIPWERFGRYTDRWIPKARILHPYPHDRLRV
jgi:group II intron reverse transcriptase/maturase